MFIDAYIIAVPEDKKQEYIRVAEVFSGVMKDYGVIEISENWESDVPNGEVTDFRRAVKAESDEKIVVSWVVWPDKATRDNANETMYDDERLNTLGDMPFDGKRMVLGGFEPILRYQKA